MPAVGAHVAAQRRHLDDRAVGDRGDRAMHDSRGHRLDSGGLQPADDFLRRMDRRDVDVGDRKAQQRVAHRATDIARRALLGTERHGQPVEAGPLRPVGGGQGGGFVHGHVSLCARLTIIAAVAPQMRRSPKISS